MMYMSLSPFTVNAELNKQLTILFLLFFPFYFNHTLCIFIIKSCLCQSNVLCSTIESNLYILLYHQNIY
jgi:hypothetical protein